jgi:hypothetical protein
MSPRRRWQLHVVRRVVVATLLGAIAMTFADGQNSANEHVFPQSKAAVEKALKSLQAQLGGRLPVLDGFATSDHSPDHSLDRYQRGYYQASVQVSPVSGGSLVRVSVKVTAWYADPAGTGSGYQLLTSNGRLEMDLLDQLGEQLAKASPEETKPDAVAATKPVPAPPTTVATTKPPPAQPSTTITPAKPLSTPPVSTTPSTTKPSAATETSAGNLSSSMNQSLEAQERSMNRPAEQPVSGTTDRELQAEADSLREVLKNQVHPKNLVAVKKSGTPVVGTPSLNAKPIFLASLHDEFEMIDFNRDWVHVRVSGLSRGWIWRNSLEMPEGISDTVVHSESAPLSAQDLYHVTREETAQFPGDWQPLRGKNVKIISVQKVDDNAKDGGPQDKLAYAKYLLDKSYAEIAQKPAELSGIVLIFDSVDGGMIAATLASLQQWKSGTLSDAAFWHGCFFDPPETFGSQGSSGTQ